MFNAWRREILIALTLLLVATVIGSFTGSFLYLLLLFLIIAFIVQLREINRLENWLRTGALGTSPSGKGIWDEIYYHLYRIKKLEKKRKKRLGKILEQFRRSTSALPDSAVVLGSNNEIEWANKAARQILGLNKSDRGQRILNLIRQPKFEHYLKKNVAEGETVTLPSPINERVTLEYRVVSYSPGLRLLLAHDVTQLSNLEKMRKDFVANVSHELRTPLTVLKGYLETLRDLDEEKSELFTRSYTQMYAQTERMQHLIDDLLMLARLETRQKETDCVPISKLLKDICVDIEALNEEKRIQLSFETDKDILGDEQELRSAFTNIIVNALKYSSAETLVKVRWHQSTNSVQLDIKDQGEGIKATEIPRVTERFYRVDVNRSRNLKGTGLGLAIVKHVLMRHDAELVITSELGKGSCFSCVFPSNRFC